MCISFSPNYEVRSSRSFSLNCEVREKGPGVLILEEK